MFPLLPPTYTLRGRPCSLFPATSCVGIYLFALQQSVADECMWWHNKGVDDCRNNVKGQTPICGAAWLVYWLLKVICEWSLGAGCSVPTPFVFRHWHHCVHCSVSTPLCEHWHCCQHAMLVVIPLYVRHSCHHVMLVAITLNVRRSSLLPLCNVSCKAM